MQLQDKPKRAFLQDVIAALGNLDGQDTNPEDILQVSVAPNDDLVVGYRDAAKARELSDLCHLHCIIGNEDFYFPCALIAPQGLINPYCYPVKARATPGVGYDQILQCLTEKGYIVRDY